MTNRNDPPTEANEPTTYQIRIKGQLDERWSDWFDGLTIIPEPCGDSSIEGVVADQAALHGLLRKIRDLGLPLISVLRVVVPPVKRGECRDE
ncbi:hypothetical protein ACFPPD_24275 [Cohnella suwonensis]|uniref:Uncharacterized protein n=1 Tax=Cohnella suwonensis TaxID=696072 RepID=A0ABW0M100_9BACL